jgi:toxin ParE1/3/4
MRAIFRHIEKGNAAAAMAFVADLNAKAINLATSGFAGVSRSYISKKLYDFPYRERCFYVRVIENHLVIVRVLHGKQDVTPDLFKD